MESRAQTKTSLQAAVWAKKRKEQVERAQKLRCAAGARLHPLWRNSLTCPPCPQGRAHRARAGPHVDRQQHRVGGLRQRRAAADAASHRAARGAPRRPPPAVNLREPVASGARLGLAGARAAAAGGARRAAGDARQLERARVRRVRQALLVGQRAREPRPRRPRDALPRRLRAVVTRGVLGVLLGARGVAGGGGERAGAPRRY